MKKMRKGLKGFLIYLAVLLVVNVAILIGQAAQGKDILSIIWLIGLLDIFLVLAYLGYTFGLRPMMDGMSSDNPERRRHSFGMFGGGIFALGDANRRKQEKEENKKD